MDEWDHSLWQEKHENSNKFNIFLLATVISTLWKLHSCNTLLTASGRLKSSSLKLYCRPKKTADFLRDAVETRLRMYIPYIESWPQVRQVRSEQTTMDRCFFYWRVCLCVCVCVGNEYSASSSQHPRQPEAPLQPGGWYLVLCWRPIHRCEWILAPAIQVFIRSYLPLPFHHHLHNIRPVSSQVTAPRPLTHEACLLIIMT